MYLKSIEMQGFKSFANKIALDFHNGITGIVGPNGSGKSNVSDAVRWVLGEQSAKQLRGASMQDIIFSGTENRKPLSYAYVAITMDNADHCLDVDFEEVTVARRVYRSGESEYLLNGSVCRLKDINELFYDTGIGKEGYSIIGQGQIEKILNGRPEERRELFDEAAGIVKYKRRKATALKKLETERENLVRINDILGELERQAGPLERQSEKAKLFLKKRDELKKSDANCFLLEMEQIEAQQKETASHCEIADAQLKETTAAYESIKREYEKTEASIEALEAEIEKEREQLSDSAVTKGRLEGEIKVLEERIKSSELSDELLKSRTEEIKADKREKAMQRDSYEMQKGELDKQLSEASLRCEKARKKLSGLQESILNCNAGIEAGKEELLKLFNQKASLQTSRQKYDTLIEQVTIRKAQLNQRLLQQKSGESELELLFQKQQQEFDVLQEEIRALERQDEELSAKRREWEDKLKAADTALLEDTAKYHKTSSRLESLKNIAERYDGYGNAIRRVMEQKQKEPGLLGVVSDLIKVDRKYETAVETALGGSIQNIVTEDEATAKRMITYLKQNRFGRATFLPLTSVKAKGTISHPEALKEPGVIGLASELVEYDRKFDGIVGQLLGRIIVLDTIDHAVLLAGKYHYSLSVVTLEGEFLRPGGSMSGGAFKNSSNLLGRNREIEHLERSVREIRNSMEAYQARKEEILTAHALISDDRKTLREELQQKYLLANTAELNLKRTKQQKKEGESLFQELQDENGELDRQIEEVRGKKEHALGEIEEAKRREEEIREESSLYQEKLDEQMYLEGSVNKAFSEAQMEEASIRQKREFILENISRITSEIEKCDVQMQELLDEAKTAKEDAKQRKAEIEEIRQTILAADEKAACLEERLQGQLAKKQSMAEQKKEFFGKREEIADRISVLDKEVFRLNGQKEKLNEAQEQKISYMWEEYELTPHSAKELWEDGLRLNELKKQIELLKNEIRGLGDVNVGAVEEYRELSKRLAFLKTQHDDLIEAEAALVGIIEELDDGMRKQFAEKFGLIKQEFDRAFKELFGGGKGTLELVEEEDILECGIRIIAQPPGKKLQNMVLLSGGEKALTAIALLFAIQNLKPSPFCLLDEIEAALDESNVGRFARYLQRLSKNTQFIVITHRRGSMAAADRLYGITMQEKGISTLVSVDFIEHDLEK